MNKIFKVIWNHATQSWVAVSELNRAKSKTKSSSITKVATAVTALGLVSISGNVLAAKIDNESSPIGSTKNGNLVIGGDTDVFSNNITDMPTKDSDTYLPTKGSQWETDKSQVQDISTTYNNGELINPNNTVIGVGAQAKRTLSSIGGNSVVVGNSAVSKTGQAVVIGTSADSGAAAGTIVIGYSATADQRMINGVRHVRYYNPYNEQAKIEQITNGKANTSIIDKANASVISSGVAIGRQSHSGGGGIALGDQARALTGDENGNVIVNKFGRGLGVAIGSYSLSHSGGVAIGAAVEATGLNSMAFGRQAAAKGKASVAVGAVSAAKGDNTISVGHSATSIGNRSIAIGSSDSGERYSEANRTLSEAEKSIALGADAKVENESAKNSIAMGSNANVTAVKSSIAIGHGANVKGLDTTRYTPSGATAPTLSTQYNASDATNNIAVGSSARIEGTNNTNIGNAKVEGINIISVGSGGFREQRLETERKQGLIYRDHIAIGNNVELRSGIGAVVIGSGAVTGSNVFGDYMGISVGSAAKSYAYGVAVGAGANADQIALGDDAWKTGSVALGAYANADGIGNGSVVIGANAYSFGSRHTVINGNFAYIDGGSTYSIAVGNESRVREGHSSIALGQKALIGKANEAAAIGVGAGAYSHGAIAFGKNALAGGKAAVKPVKTQAELQALENAFNTAKADYEADKTAEKLIKRDLAAQAWERAKLENESINRETNALNGVSEEAENSVAIGTDSKAIATNAIAMGKGAVAKGNSAISIGTGNIVSGDNSGALGDPSIVDGKASYTFGNDNVVSSATTGAFVMGNRNRMGAKPTYTGGENDDINTVKVDNTATLNGVVSLSGASEELRDVSGSVAIGNDNTVTSKNTFILGNSVNTVNNLTTGKGTVENSVYLGSNSTAVAGAPTAAGSLKNIQDDGTVGTSTTAGDKGVVNTATVAGVTYQGFQGNKADGVVTVGSAGHERRIQNLAAGEISATSTDAINGSQLYLTHKAITTVSDNIPFSYTIKEGDKNVSVSDIGGEYYKDEDIENLIYNPEDKKFYNKDGSLAQTQPTPIADKSKINITATTDNTPDTINNVKGNLDPTYNRGDKKEDPTTKQLTTVGESTPTKKQDAPSAADIANMYNNAATVGDVLNAGWNLQENGDARDFVKPYDTVNFVNGTGTTVEVKTDENGKVSNIKVNTATQYVDAKGNPVTVIDGKGYPEGSVKGPDGKVYPKGTTFNADGSPVGGVTDITNNPVTEFPQVSLVNSAPGANTYANKGKDADKPLVKVGDKYYAPDQFTNGKLNENATPTELTAGQDLTSSANRARNGLADLEHSNPTNVMTVADAKNLGWIVSSNKTTGELSKEYAADVRNAHEVRFVGTGLATVSGKTDNNGVRIITVDVDTSSSANNNPFEYKVTGNQGAEVPTTVGKDGNIYATEDLKDKDFINGKYYPKDSVLAKDGKVYQPGTQLDPNTNLPMTPDTAKVAEPVKPATENDNYHTVINAKGEKPRTVTNVAGTLGPTYNAGDNNIVNGVPVAKDDKNPKAHLATDPTKSVLNPLNPSSDTPASAEELAKVYNNGATVGDLLNTGWNLRNNGKARDFVKPYDTVNFSDGTGTTVEVETSADGKLSTVKVNTATQYTDAEGNPLKKIGNKFYPVNAVVDKDGNVYPEGTQLTNGAAPAGTKQETPVNPKISLVNADGSSTTPTVLGNLAQGANTITNLKDANNKPLIKVGDKYYKVEDLTNGSPTASAVPLIEKNGKYYTPDQFEDNGNLKANPTETAVTEVSDKPVDKAKAGLADLDKSNANNALTVADAKNLGWVVSSDKTTGDLTKEYADDVRNTQEVRFVGTGLATVSGKTENNVRTITVDVNAQTVAETAQLPVVYTDKKGNKLVKGKDGNFYPADSVLVNGKYYPKGSVVSKNGNVYPEGTQLDTDGNPVVNNGTPAPSPETELQPKQAGDVIASMNNAAGSTNNPMALSNIASNLSPVDTKTILTENGTPVANPFNGKAAPNLSTALQDPNGAARNNAATIGDVLNSGWNLQGNGEAKDFVRHTDTVNFANGIGTTVNVITDQAQKISEIRVNSLIGLTDENGAPVIKGADNKFYKVDANGQPDKNQPVEADKLVANIINPAATAPNQKGDALQLGNIAAGAKTFDNEVGGNLGADPVTLANDGKWYGADDVDTNGKPKAGATAIPAPKGNDIKAGLIDFNNSNPNNALTVEDARNLGWIVSTSENQYADQVRNANKVDFKGSDGISVKGETNADGVREITISLKKGEVISSNGEAPKTKDDNTPLTKVDDKYFKTTDIKDGIVKVATPGGEDKYYKVADVTIDDKGVATPKENAIALTPINSDNVISGDAGAGFVTGNQVGDAIQKSGFTVGKVKDTDASFPNTFDNKDEKVNPDDNLRFADGKGTTVSLGTVKAVDNDGIIKTTTTVKVDIDTGELENNGDGSVKDIADATKLKALRDAEKKVAKAKQALADAEKAKEDAKQAVVDAEKAQADATQAVKDAEKALADNQDPTKKDELQKALDAAKEKANDPALAEAVKIAKEKANDPALDKEIETAKAEAAKPELAKAVTDAKAELAKDPGANKVATAQNVADAINKSGFTLKTSATDSGEKVSGEDELINPGKTVEMVAGKNMTVKQEANGKITYATKDKVEFTEVTVKDAAGNSVVTNSQGITINNGVAGAPVSLTQKGLDNGGNKITNVAAGEADTDAVNVKQLKDAISGVNNNIGDVNNRINKLDKRMRGIGANAAAAASLPQVYIPGKSMVAAAAGGYNGASAIAVGYSRASDNGKIILKLTGTANSTGQYSGGVGVGYQW